MLSYTKTFFVFALTLSLSASAQRYLGIATSDRCAINSLYLNPASIADSREKMSISILSFNGGVDNDLGPLPKIPNVGNAISNADNIFTTTQKKKFSMLVPEAVVRGPGIMANLSKRLSVAVTTGIRAINQLNNFDPALYRMFADSSRVPATDYSAKAQNFNWTGHMWSEIGLTIGATVLDHYEHRLNIGATIRRLGGIGYIGVIGKNLDLSYRKDINSFSATNSDVEFSSNVLNDSSQVFKHITPGGLLNDFFGEKAGSGMSLDVGFTYRYRIGEPEPSDYMESTATHDLVFSAAVTDFGSVRYYNGTDASLNITGNGFLASEGLKSNAGSVASLASYARTHGFGVDTIVRSMKVYLPAALVISTDAQVYGRFYTNLLYIANLASRQRFGNSYYGQVTLTPRYDFHKMTVALPFTYSMLAQDFKMGVAARYAGFYIGSDDMLAIFQKGQYGFDFYIGAYVPIFRKNNDPVGLHWGT
jgi:hypothetical protein